MPTKPTRIKRLQVCTPTGAAGQLHRESQYVFNYETTDRVNEVSLTMPIRAQSYASAPLMPVFAMNLPEGYLFEMIARQLAKHEQVDDMRLLAITGRHQIGRLQFVEPGAEWQDAPASIGLKQLLREASSHDLFAFLIDTYFQSGISGVQPKVMMPDADKTDSGRLTIVQPDLIVKAAGMEYESLTQNEFLCMDAARRAGLTVPDFWLSDDGALFVMHRFDLAPERLGFEDLSVLMGKPRDKQGHYKYTESYEAIARVIAHYSGTQAPTNLQAFFQYLTLSVMVRNGDAHLKNFGMLYAHPHAAERRLAPLYDVVTTSVYPHVNLRTGETRYDRTMALKFFSGAKHRNYPSREDLLRFGATVCLVRKPEQVIDRIASAMSDAWQAHRNRLQGQFATAFAAEWDAGRTSLSPPQVYVSNPTTAAPEPDNAQAPQPSHPSQTKPGGLLLDSPTASEGDSVRPRDRARGRAR